MGFVDLLKERAKEKRKNYRTARDRGYENSRGNREDSERGSCKDYPHW